MMGTKSHETMFGPSIRASAEKAAAARKEAECLACEAWNKRMLGYRGPAQPSPTLGDALNAGYLLSRSALPRLRHAPDRCARHRAATEGHAHPRARAIHAMPGLFAGSRLSLQAQPSGRAAGNEDFGPPSTWWPGERRRPGPGPADWHAD